MRFRPDIEGLRAVAVSLVVLYHAGVPWLSGGYVGVDVFFVVSGFLMTSLILRELTQTGRVDLRSFYARRIRRLLPAAVLVLLATILLAKLVLAPLELTELSHASVATALYASNLWFAFAGTDYLASDAPSVLQHYWSLAVEEQFYVIWPVVLLFVHRVGRGSRKAFGLVVGLVVLASLAMCVHLTQVSQPWAFFSLPTRAWELAAGGLVALLSTSGLRFSNTVGRVLSWFGLAIILTAAATFTEDFAFPGWMAIVPVMGAVAAILGGGRRINGSADVVLTLRPVQLVGRLSYSLYLWHWPLLVLAAAGVGELEPGERTVVVALTVLVAWVTYRLVENPIRRARPLQASAVRNFSLGAILTAAGVTAAILVGVLPRLATDVRVTPLTSGVAATTLPVSTVVPANVRPSLPAVLDDLPLPYANGCHADFLAVVPPDCRFGDQSADRSMFLVGDSHAAQWFPAMDELARSDHWALTSLTKSSCPAAEVPVESAHLGRLYSECSQWRDAVVQRIARDQPDLVVLSNYSMGYQDLVVSGGAFLRNWADGLRRFVDQLPQSTKVVILGDTPSWPAPPVNCLSANLMDAQRCSQDVRLLVSEHMYEAERSAVAATAGARTVFEPTAPWLCGDVCSPLAADVVVYRDRHHVTATIAELLVQRLRTAVGVMH
ncbi:acyltransferase family protein [Geodermatophilus sp. SYSU D00965]